MKKLLSLTLLSLSFVSCMEVENPVCNSINRVDIQNLPQNLSVNLYDKNFDLQQIQSRITRIGKGLYDTNGQGVMEVCSVSGRTLIQTKTKFNTYKLFSYSIGKDSVSFPDYIINKQRLDDEGIPYQVVHRESDSRLEKFTQDYKSNGQESIVVERIPENLIPELITLSPTFSFSY